MRILVTGAAGFIGSHLINRLVAEGNEVIGVDNLSTGSRENISDLFGNPLLEFISHDIISPLTLAGQVDQIYNLACPASPVQYQKNPVRTVKTNTLGVINILGLARKHEARVLQASTSEVYGDPTDGHHPQTEEYRGSVNTIGPRACYDEGKRVAETLFFDYHRTHGIEIKVVRIFNTYGPRMAFDDGRVVSNFIVSTLKGAPLLIDGDGSQTRSFCYVDDLVRGLIRMMNTDKSILGPINLGNPVETSIKEIAELILSLSESKSSLVFSGKFREDDPMQRCPDIAKAKDLLDWEPIVALEDGLKKTIEDFRKRVSRV